MPPEPVTKRPKYEFTHRYDMIKTELCEIAPHPQRNNRQHIYIYLQLYRLTNNMPEDINIELIHIFWKKKINYQILEFLNNEGKPKKISEVAAGIAADKTDVRRAVIWDRKKSKNDTSLTSLGLTVVSNIEGDAQVEITEKGMKLLWMTCLIRP